MTIDEIMQKLDREDMFPAIKRKSLSFGAESALRCVQRIGTRVCPNFALDSANRAVFLDLVSWLMGQPFTAKDPITKKDIAGRVERGIYLYGGTGAGKSVAMDILKVLCDLDNLVFSYGKKVAPLKWRKVRADEITREFLDTGSVSRWVEERSLLIDDLGNEPQEVMYMGNRVDAVRMVLEARGDRRDQFTLITSNLPLGQVKQTNPILNRYGARVESRLIEMCNYIYLGGVDRRTTL